MPKRRAKKPKLTPRQRRFVDEYLVDLNGTQAAIRAGYSVATANEQAARLLANVSVKHAVEHAQALRVNRLQVKQDEVVQELMRIAMADPFQLFDKDGALLDVRKMPAAIRRAISSIEVEEIFSGRGEEKVQVGRVRKLRMWNKPEALKVLAQHIGMLKTTVDVNVKRGVVFLPTLEGNELESEPGPAVPLSLQ